METFILVFFGGLLLAQVAVVISFCFGEIE